MIKSVTSILVLLAICAGGGAVYGQVGVNTDNPNATLDVQGVAEDPAVVDGVIPPRITKSQLTDKTVYGTPQTGAVVYITDATGPVNPATRNIQNPGLHIFDGTVWNQAVVFTETSGSDVKKIQTIGPVNPNQTIANGILEFRLRAGIYNPSGFEDADAMVYEVRVAPDYEMTNSININISSFFGIGRQNPLPDSHGQVTGLLFTTSDRNQWKVVGKLLQQDYAHMTYMSVNEQGSTTPIFYILNAQRIGGNQGLPKLKTLVINRY